MGKDEKEYKYLRLTSIHLFLQYKIKYNELDNVTQLSDRVGI